MNCINIAFDLNYNKYKCFVWFILQYSSKYTSKILKYWKYPHIVSDDANYPTIILDDFSESIETKESKVRSAIKSPL